MIRRLLLAVAAALLVLISALGFSGSASERRAERRARTERAPAFVDAYQPDLPSADEIDPSDELPAPAVTR